MYKLYNISLKQSIEYQKIGELHTNGIFEMYEIPMNGALAVYVMRKGEAIITLCKIRGLNTEKICITCDYSEKDMFVYGKRALQSQSPLSFIHPRPNTPPARV